jgi:hypothetical protein
MYMRFCLTDRQEVDKGSTAHVGLLQEGTRVLLVHRSFLHLIGGEPR